jgi:hypothetical protein
MKAYAHTPSSDKPAQDETQTRYFSLLLYSMPEGQMLVCIGARYDEIVTTTLISWFRL